MRSYLGIASLHRVVVLTMLGAFAMACGGATGNAPEGIPTDDSASETNGDGSGDETTSDGGSETSPADGSDDTGPADTTPPSDGAPGDGGIIPGCGMDTDGDGIIDLIEGKGKGPGGKDVDTDGDGTPDYLDLDSDNDGIPDKVEWFKGGCMTTPFEDLNDADGDGIPNFQDLDSDGNGYPDKDEACPPVGMPTGPSSCVPNIPSDFDGDGVPDFLDFDNDHDSVSKDKSIGLSDKTELSDSTGKYIGLVDTDKDGIPDLYDRDSDNDFILDLEDGITDPDADGKPNFRDDDSDGDTVSDWCEARAKATASAADYDLPLLDTDSDGVPDFLDKDSDNDLLSDGKEDKNNNCLVDTAETDRIKADTDGDGVGDMVEVTLLGVPCAKDPACTPAKSGKFYFLEPYSKDGSAKPTPTTSPLALSTKLNKGDVGFVVDTTYSMSGEISNLKSSLSSTIIPALATKIPDLGVGVMGHDDVPVSDTFGSTTPYWGSCTPYPTLGLPADQIFYIPSTGTIRDVSVGGVTVPAKVTEAQTAVNALRLANGDDLPESQVPALLRALRGDALSWSASSICPAGSFAADPGDGVTNMGALRFRKAALPILIGISDAMFHNGRKAGSTVVHDAYTGIGASLPTETTLVTAINAVGAKFIGVAAADTSTPDTDAAIRNVASVNSAYGDMAYITDNTGSNVPPAAFGGTCKTGIGGAAVAADGPGGTCRLIFSLRHNGTGLGTTIVDGVYALLAAVKFDVYVQAFKDPADTVDSVDAFMEKVEPSPTGGTDPVTGGVCVTFPSTQVADNFHTPKAIAGAGDIKETITGVNPGPLYCFNVVPKPNITVVATTDVQIFRAWLRVLAIKPTGGTFTLGSDREVIFLVPPVLN